MIGQNVSIQENYPFNVSVSFMSNPISNLTWFKDKKPVNGFKAFVYRYPQPFTFMQRADLTSPASSRNLSGIYFATACNMIGCLTSHEIYVLITCKFIHLVFNMLRKHVKEKNPWKVISYHSQKNTHQLYRFPK